MFERMRSLGLSRIPYFTGQHKAIPIGGTKAGMTQMQKIDNEIKKTFGDLT